MNTNDSNPDEKREERKATIEVKKEIYAEEIFAEINKVKADLENQIRSRDSKVENLETTIEELRRQVPVSQKNQSNSELLEQLKEKDSRILLMGSNSKRIITQMKQKLLTKNEKIRKMGEENLNNAKQIKLLEEELSKHNENIKSTVVNLNDARVNIDQCDCEDKSASNDLDTKRDHFESVQNVDKILVKEGVNDIGTKPDANPIDTKLSANKENNTEDDNNAKAVNNKKNVIVDDTESIGCRSTSNKLDLKYSKNYVNLKISEGEKILRDEVAPANTSQNVEAIENFRDICVGKNGSLKITVAMASKKIEKNEIAKDRVDFNESSRFHLKGKNVNSDINKRMKFVKFEDEDTVTKKSYNIPYEADHDLTCCCCSNKYTNIKRKTCHSHNDDHSKDADNHTKDAYDHTKNAVNNTKDADNHTKDADDHNKDADDHTKDAVDHTKDADDHTKDADDHTKDADDHTKDADDHTKDADDHTKDADAPEDCGSMNEGLNPASGDLDEENDCSEEADDHVQ